MQIYMYICIYVYTNCQEQLTHTFWGNFLQLQLSENSMLSVTQHLYVKK